MEQTAGISTTPESFRSKAALRNWYGHGAHVISYPVSPDHTSWAVTLSEGEESKETWRLYNEVERGALQEQLGALLHDWAPEVQQLVQTSERIIKFGIFDRPELQPEQWHSRRCVLVGDAAHPTSPHLGQGANQALYVLTLETSWLSILKQAGIKTNPLDTTAVQGGLLSSVPCSAILDTWRS